MPDKDLYLQHEEPLFAAQNTPDHFPTLPVTRARCGGCASEYRSLDGLLVIAVAMLGHPWKVFFDSPDCARKRGHHQAAALYEKSLQSGEPELFVDPDGNVLPAWRIAELRGEEVVAEDLIVAPRSDAPMDRDPEMLQAGYQQYLLEGGNYATALLYEETPPDEDETIEEPEVLASE